MPKNPLELSRQINPSLRDRFNRWLKYGGRGNSNTVDKWNKEFVEIEKGLPFKDDEEHNVWSNMADTWMGEPEWEDLTNELIARTEPNYVDSGKAAQIVKTYKDNHPKWYK